MDADFWEEHKPKFLEQDPSKTTPIVAETPPMKPYIEGDPYPTVPAELKARRQWVVWLNHFKTGDDKPSKMLYQTNGWAASTSNPRTWTTYPLALACYQEHTARQSFEYRYRDNLKVPYQHLTCDLAGIGYVFSTEDPLSGVDLDNCIDANRNIKPWARPIVEKLKPVSYGEVSPNNHGIKWWTRAHLPEIAKHKVYLDEANGEAIEVYDSKRYFTVTGRGKGQIADGQAVIDWLVKEYMTPEPTPKAIRTPRTAPQANLKTADAVIQRIRQSRQCHKFDALMRGDITGYGSQSEADIALCSVIAFWTQDTTVIDDIFRQSQLYREKWDEKHKGDGATYGEMTIEKALSGQREVYKPRRRLQSRASWLQPGTSRRNTWIK